MVKSFQSGIFFLLVASTAYGQCIPVRQENFLTSFNYQSSLPARILNGRTLLFFNSEISAKELLQIQQSLAGTGVDAILALEFTRLLGGHDVRLSLYKSVQKREVSNLIFFERLPQGYRCTATAFDGTPAFVKRGQPAWSYESASLGELLLQINREALGNFKRQNFLVNEVPETELALRLIEGSRIEGFTPDLRIDRVAVRIDTDDRVNQKLKETCGAYPFGLEFVPDSLTDQELRQRGFWYVLNCVVTVEEKAREWLGFSPVKENPLAPQRTPNRQLVYKFYLKKLEFNNSYVGKSWDAHPEWDIALANFIANLRNELNVR